MEIDELVALAVQTTERCRALAAQREDWRFMGYVGAALVTQSGQTHTGISLDLLCGIGFCAEHSAVAEMLKSGESRIELIGAATAAGEILPPCGRCRELLYEVDPLNLDTLVVMPDKTLMRLGDLFPENWQNYMAALHPTRSR